MFELKKHVKERLIKRTEGIISLLLIVLLVPFYSVAAILEEVGRYQSALRGLDSAISSSEMSVLAQYDQFLMDRFALLAIDQNKNIDQQFLSYLKKQDTQDTRSFSLSNAQTKATGVYPLADIEVLYQQINEFSTYTVPTKLILEGVNFDNIVSQLEGYSTTVSNVIKQLNSVGSSLQGGLDSYNAQKEASEQLDAVTKTTGEYAESYNRFKNAMDSLIEHKKTERPENEKEAAQWDEQLKNLLQEANTAKDDYQNQIDKERDGISSLAKKFDTAASKERSAYDTLVDGVTTAVSTKQASEKDVLNKNIQDNKGVIKEIDRQLAALGDDPQGENREEKSDVSSLADFLRDRKPRFQFRRKISKAKTSFSPLKKTTNAGKCFPAIIHKNKNEMIEISSISTDRMSHGAHFAYHTETVGCIEADTKVKNKVSAQLQAYKTALRKTRH